ncbi:MAG: ATP-binding cassette domain-containing protein [Treponema sp.]|nr:ATP-binding cassette domain-containing protein [Treponema sp.]
MLEIKDACVSYGKSRVINGISMSLQGDEKFLVLGRNGVGKTTFMKSIIGLLPMDSGSISFDGKDITKTKAHERSLCGIAYVPQGREIIPMLTVRENLQLGCIAHKNVKFEEKMEEVLTYLPDLTPHLRRKGGVLSGGQQQQLAIARALMSDPKVLILDEPTEGIQPNIVMEIADILNRYQQSKKIPLIIVEQNLHFARRIGDRFMIIQKGAVVKTGKIDELTDEISAKYISV